jgi:prepilin-type N-terminal cleavage/methylation domain-containing protein
MGREKVDQLNPLVHRTEEIVSKPASPRGTAGFTLIEAMIALAILSFSLLSLAQAFCLGMRHMATSSANLIAREKAREAVESVHTARDTGTIAWSQIKNVSNGGVFLNGAQALHEAGADGLINTADDASAPLEVQRDAGPDGILNNTDDRVTTLSGLTRQVEILELSPVNPDLRQVRVTITYQVGAARGSYTLRTFISSFS